MTAAALQITFAAPARRSLALVRGAVRRFTELHGRQPEAGANVAGYFTRARAARAGAIAAGWLELDSDALRLTAAGLAAVAPCASCGAEGRCPCRKPRRAPRRRRPREEAPAAAPAAQEARAEAPTVATLEVQAEDLAIVLERLPRGEGRATMTGVRRRQGEIYRRRAQRALFGALRAWERTFSATIAPGADVAGRLRGKRRYWQAGLGAGWLRLNGRAVEITAEGIEAARAYVPPAPSAPVPFGCCAALRGADDHGHAPACGGAS